MTPYTDEALEADFRAALDVGNPDRIGELAREIDQREKAAASVPLIAAALWYGEQGLPVFPLRRGTKAPMPMCGECKSGKEFKCAGPEVCGHDLCHGLKDATTNTERITRWWQEYPEANIGLATGHLVDVVDVDGALGQTSRALHWDNIFDSIDADNVAKVLTPRPGGMHIWVPPTGDGNSQGIVTGVDYRGRGGYVVLPPSVLIEGCCKPTDTPGAYRFLGTPTLGSLRQKVAS